MSRHARKSFLGGCAVAPDLGKTDESNSGAFGLITGGEERFELYRHTIGELRERPADHVSLIGDEQPPSSRRCGCRPTVRFWSSGAPSASARCPRGRARPGVTERRVTGSTDAAEPIYEVAATAFAEVGREAIASPRALGENRCRRQPSASVAVTPRRSTGACVAAGDPSPRTIRRALCELATESRATVRRRSSQPRRAGPRSAQPPPDP
jgi:hypothetical protein